MQEQQQKHEKQNYLRGAAILAAASIFVKIIGAIYKIPLFQDEVLGDEGTADFSVTYSVYALILTISTAGVPTALSRLISTAKAKGDEALAQRYFSVAMPSFFLIGLTATLIMYIFAEDFARLMGNSMAELGIRVLSPAILFACIISIYRGYAQGNQNMIPTALSQIVEVMSKAVFGIAAALLLVSLGYDSHIVSAGAIVGVTIGLGLCIPIMFRYKRKHTAITADDTGKCELRPFTVFARIMRVSIPITLSASFISIMVVIDNAIVLGRLQSALLMTEAQARALFGIYSRATAVYNLVPALLVPISVSIIPAIAASIAVRQHKEAQGIMQSSVKLVNLIAMPASAGIIVLAMPILSALYNDQREIASNILTILGAASFFVCLQYVTTSILQANGFERISLITFPIGAACKIAISWVFTANPAVGILASPIGTLACFLVISVMNLVFIKTRIREGRPKFFAIFLKPLLCSAVMAAAAYGAYALFSRLTAGFIRSTRAEAIVFLACAVITGIAVYGVLIIISRTVTTEDMKLLPKGEKIGKFLRVRNPYS